MAELFTTTLFNDANLIAYWRFEGNSNDAKGTDNGTDTAITYNTGNGRFNQGAGFNGTTSNISIQYANLQPTGNFTIASWIKATSDVGNHVCFQSYSQNTNVAGIQIGINVTAEGAHKGLFLSGKNTGATGGVDYQRVVGGTTIDDGFWHQLVGVWNGTQLLLYVDGVLDATAVSWANAPAYAATNYIRIGCENISGTNQKFWNNAIDDVALFSRVLSQSEITLLFLSSFMRIKTLLGVGQ